MKLKRFIDYGHPAARYVMAGVMAGGAVALGAYSVDYASVLTHKDADSVIRAAFDRCVKDTRHPHPPTGKTAIKPDAPETANTNVAAVCPAHDRRSYSTIAAVNFGLTAWIALFSGMAAFGFRRATLSEQAAEDERAQAKQAAKAALIAKPAESPDPSPSE